MKTKIFKLRWVDESNKGVDDVDRSTKEATEKREI